MRGLALTVPSVFPELKPLCWLLSRIFLGLRGGSCGACCCSCCSCCCAGASLSTPDSSAYRRPHILTFTAHDGDRFVLYVYASLIGMHRAWSGLSLWGHKMPQVTYLDQSADL